MAKTKTAPPAPEAQPTQLTGDAATIADLRATIDGLTQDAYVERNRCVAALARMAVALGLQAWLGRHPDEDTTWDADWRTIVFIRLPTGQISWHVHDSELPLFEFLRDFQGEPWDGHDTPEKYERLAAFTPPRRAG